ncbi:unnamed protein product [Calicophoron daubneyi]|uniref:Cysteine protease n=1 Tax=Calicophoron daubneyi TaxID=300641 RepID=A0AAV2TUK6_CALDB
MENQWEAIFSYATSPPDHPYLPNVDKPVYILGEKYESVKDRKAIADHLRSLFWMTYRKGFPPIFLHNGPVSDAGWGCMHRCSQMMLAEAISRVHLGRAWRWEPGCEDEAYLQIRRMFKDNKYALYSIQNIYILIVLELLTNYPPDFPAMIGMAVDKPIGSWFGPNTAAQVIKKLSAYDPFTDWLVHISVEDGVIVDEIKSRCQQDGPPSRYSSESYHSLPFIVTPPNETVDSEWNLEAIKARVAEDAEVIVKLPSVSPPVTRDLEEDFLEIVLPPTFDFVPEAEPPSAEVPTSSDPSTTTTTKEVAVTDRIESKEPNDNQSDIRLISTRRKSTTSWRPLLLFVPLRLGLYTPNPCYFDAIKTVLQVKQCVGIMGGRPSHAVWIVGTVEDDVLCLDPHTTQPASLDTLTPEDDLTHHCESPIRMPLKRLDPSMVLGFVCPTEAEFDEFCATLEQHVLNQVLGGGRPLFEMHKTRPHYLPPMPSSSMLISLNCSNDEGGGVAKRSPSDSCALVDVEKEDSAHPPSKSNSDGGDDNPAPDQQESRLTEAMNTVRTIWSKCNQVAGDTVRSLAKPQARTTSGTDFEVI